VASTDERSAFEHTLSRRGFMKAGGLTVGGLLAAGAGGLTSDGLAALLKTTPVPLKGKKVGIASPITVEILKEFYDDMRRQAVLKGNGESIVVVDANADSVKQHTQVDAFIAQKYNAIVMLVLSAEGWDDAMAKAKSAGIGTFNHSASAIGGTTQNVGLDQRAGGYGPGAYAAQWINKNQSGKASVGVLAILNDPQLKLRSEGFKEALGKLAPGAKVVGEVHAQTRDAGAAAAANLLQAHPEISVIYAGGDDPGLGAFTAATEAGKKDPSKFFIASSDGTDAVLEKITEGGIYQASWTFLFPFSATQFERDIESFLRGKAVKPTRIMIGQMVTNTNLNSIKKLQSNPKAPRVQWVYTRRMRYSNYKLQTNEPFLNAFNK
jgi:ABC-type sugar transport system substrate-binding protein